MTTESERLAALEEIGAAMKRLHEVVRAPRKRKRLPFCCEAVRGRPFGFGFGVDERRTALREASYIRRTKLYHAGEEHAFTDRGRDLVFLTTVAPPDSPAWVGKPQLRWGLADEAAGPVSPGNTKVRAWHVCADLPNNVTRGEWLNESELLVRLALPDAAVVDIVGHTPVDKPAHVHMLVATRYIAGHGYGDEIPDLRLAIEQDLQALWLSWLSPRRGAQPCG